jgi:hypothetical protein
MGKFLEPLFDSIVQSAFANDVEEILFVCEKSTDGSEDVIAKLQRRQIGKLPGVRMIQPDQRRGLFVARYLGAKAARTPKIMYIDSRITLPERAGRALPDLIRKYPAMSCNVDIDITKNVYCLYWQRSHETIFRSTYVANSAGPVTVTEENFSRHRIGGTCFYCSREPFVRLSEKYMNPVPLFNDDTYLMADLVKVEPFTVHPDFRINWEPRDTAKSFIKHLYTRGPGFAQYNFFRARGALFYVTVMGVLYLLATVAMLFVNQFWSIGLIAAGIGALMLSTAFFVKSIGEFFRLAPLHAAVIMAYGFGSLKGAWIVWKKTGFHVPRAESDHERKLAG